MTAFDNIEKAKAIWRLVLPDITLPPDSSFFRWLYSFSIEDVERAISRVPWRFQKDTNPEPLKVYKFVTSTLVWLREQRGEQ